MATPKFNDNPDDYKHANASVMVRLPVKLVSQIKQLHGKKDHINTIRFMANCVAAGNAIAASKVKTAAEHKQPTPRPPLEACPQIVGITWDSGTGGWTIHLDGIFVTTSKDHTDAVRYQFEAEARVRAGYPLNLKHATETGQLNGGDLVK